MVTVEFNFFIHTSRCEEFHFGDPLPDVRLDLCQDPEKKLDPDPDLDWENNLHPNLDLNLEKKLDLDLYSEKNLI